MTTVISTGSNGTGPDDAYVSDDSGSTLSSDLDHDITVDVLLPDNSIERTTILASTPLSDIRTQLLSKFKFSPSSYNVDFISSKQLTKTKRKASLAIGKLDVTMITIKSNKVVNEPTSPKMPYSKESTVRLLVRIARQRQSIIRVSPDVPLSTIFQTICDKLHLSEEARAGLEFRHPTQNELTLQPKLTLSQYNLRELYLADKQDAPAPAPVASSRNKQKRKAPGPPRPPQPQINPTKKTAPVEEVPTHKKRAAPLPPCAKPRTIKKSQDDKTTESKKPENDKKENETKVEEQDDVVNDNETKQATDELDRVLQEEFTLPLCENSNENSDASDQEMTEKEIPIKTELENISDDIEENKVDNPTTNQNEVLPNDSQNVVTNTTIQLVEETTEKEIETKSEEDADSLSDDDIIDLVNKPQPSPIFLTSNNEVSEKKEASSESARKAEDLVTADVDVEIEDKSNEIETTEEVCGEIDINADKKVENEQITTEKTEEEFFPPPPDSMLEEFPLPPPPVTMETKNINVNDVECFTIKEATTIPTSQPSKQSVVLQQSGNNGKINKEDDDGFDLHIAESFNIPIEAIGEKKSPPPTVLPKPVRKVAEKKIVEQDENANNLPSQPQEKLSEVDQAELEIKKIHLQINRMKSRRQKQLENEQVTLKKQNGQAGSFICIPNQTNEKVVHENYDVPKQGIKLSKQGEIKGLNIQRKNKTDNSTLQPATKPKQALPSYYKKFLGVNAFKDGVK